RRLSDYRRPVRDDSECAAAAAVPARLRRETGAVRRRLHRHGVQRAAPDRARVRVRAGDEEARPAGLRAMTESSVASHKSSVARPVACDWLFWGAVWLALVLVGVKTYYLWMRGDLNTIEVADDLSSLAAITYRDVAFVLAAWAIARALLFASGERRWAARIVLIVFLLLGTLVCLYQIASIIAFGVLGGFLTYALLQLVGNVRMLSSSVGAYLNRHVELGLVTVPLTYVGLVWLTTRLPALAGGRRWLRGAVVSTLLIAWIIVGQRT